MPWGEESSGNKFGDFSHIFIASLKSLKWSFLTLSFSHTFLLSLPFSLSPFLTLSLPFSLTLSFLSWWWRQRNSIGASNWNSSKILWNGEFLSATEFFKLQSRDLVQKSSLRRRRVKIVNWGMFYKQIFKISNKLGCFWSRKIRQLKEQVDNDLAFLLAASKISYIWTVKFCTSAVVIILVS